MTNNTIQTAQNAVNRITFAQFQEAAKRTCASLPTLQDDYVHMALGLVTEAGEITDIAKKWLAYKKPVDVVNLKEELGDSFWYVFNGLSLVNSIADDSYYLAQPFVLPNGLTVQKCFIEYSTELCLMASDILEDTCLKHGLSQEKLHYYIGWLARIAELFGIDIHECLALNINKLKVRFPDKFTEQAATNRDLDAELKALERDNTSM